MSLVYASSSLLPPKCCHTKLFDHSCKWSTTHPRRMPPILQEGVSSGDDIGKTRFDRPRLQTFLHELSPFIGGRAKRTSISLWSTFLVSRCSYLLKNGIRRKYIETYRFREEAYCFLVRRERLENNFNGFVQVSGGSYHWRVLIQIKFTLRQRSRNDIFRMRVGVSVIRRARFYRDKIILCKKGKKNSIYKRRVCGNNGNFASGIKTVYESCPPLFFKLSLEFFWRQSKIIFNSSTRII